MTKRLVFIASGGRTGTQFFGHRLGEILPDCHSEHEPDMVAGLSALTFDRVRRFGAWHMGPGRALGLTGVRRLGERYLTGTISAARCFAQLRAARRAYHAGIDRGLVVESYYAWWMFAECLGEIWPGARLAGVIRDPRAWIASWQRHAPRRRNGAWSERWPPGPLTPRKLGEPISDRDWRALGQVGRLAWEWALIEARLAEAAAQNPSVAVFRFEDLFSGRPQALEPFLRFVLAQPDGPLATTLDPDLAVADVRNASAPTHSGGAVWEGFSPAEAGLIDRFCRPGMT
ncbi:MAG: hypothetical protein AAGE13_16085, partial [Pseudomonadota bacterium]